MVVNAIYLCILLGLVFLHVNEKVVCLVLRCKCNRCFQQFCQSQTTVSCTVQWLAATKRKRDRLRDGLQIEPTTP